MKNGPESPPAPDFQALFEGAPALYLVLTPDLTIVTATEAYLRVTGMARTAIVGRPLVDVFTDNRDDPAALGISNLRASLERVRATLVPDTMAVHTDAVPRPESDGGALAKRHWRPTNSPLLDTAGALAYIIHRLEDVTEA